MVRYISYEYLIILYIKARIQCLIISLLGKRRNRSAFVDEEVECSDSDKESDEEEEDGKRCSNDTLCNLIQSTRHCTKIISLFIYRIFS